MPGFTDVTGWSSRDIQRLGHEDDDRLPIKIYGSKTKKPTFSYLADDVWAAACQAQKVNGTYVKDGQTSVLNPDVICKSNRQITFELLEDLAQITDESREQGKKVRQYYQGLTFKVLKGIKLNDFDNNVMVISNRDVINENFDLAVIASLPNSYIRAVERDTVDQRIKSATGGYISKPGLKATLIKLEVLKSIFSHKYNVNFITGITHADEVVFFSYKESIMVGQNIIVNGTVKSHRDNSTQLSRVKLV
jgi:hypothetical protein